MRGIKCKYCGRIYDSPSIMRTKKCHSHPKGAWCGYCTPDDADSFFWSMEKQHEDYEKREEEKERENEAFVYEYKKHTPLLDRVLEKDFDDKPSEYRLRIKNSDLHGLSLDLANGLNKETRDAINTIYALRDGCDYVLTNPEAQQEGSLNTWLDEVKQLKEEVANWDFWCEVYWLTKAIKSEFSANDAKDDFETNRDNWNYWHLNSIAELFHTRHVMPMLRSLGYMKKADEAKEREVARAIKNHVRKLKSTEDGFSRIFDLLEKRIEDGSFWGTLYCLYWMQLRPTPWSNEKVWPIQSARKPSATAQQQPPQPKPSTSTPPKMSCSDYAKKLREAYSKNFAPFEKLWIYNRTTLVFDGFKDSIRGKTVAIDVAVLPDGVNVTLFMRDGNLEDVQAFVNGDDILKELFPEVVAQRLRHSKIPYAEVPAFIDRFLAEFRW